MQNPEFKAQFEMDYQEFALSEIILQLMEEERISVRELAKAAAVSPAVIQDIRSGARANITLRNLSKIIKALGGRIVIQTDVQYLPLEG